MLEALDDTLLLELTSLELLAELDTLLEVLETFELLEELEELELLEELDTLEELLEPSEPPLPLPHAASVRTLTIGSTVIRHFETFMKSLPV